MGLFESFEADAHLSLLYLKHLEQIELQRRLNEDTSPRLCYKVRVKCKPYSEVLVLIFLRDGTAFLQYCIV